LELAFDTWMTGKPGAKRVIRDRKGRSIEDVDLIAPAEPGRDLHLSLDLRLQYLAWRELKAAIHEHRASSGSVVVLDVQNGEVLAMANWPSFNPNVRQREASANWRNRAVTDVFEPGSVIKTFTIAAALESGKFKPNTPIDTTPGTLPVGRHVVRDVHPYGVLDVTRVLTKSSNVGATKMALSLSNEQLYDVFRRFGFGQVTGSGFPGESPGILPHPRQWREVEKATLSYGYGLSTTALQLAQAHAAIARGGRIQTPSFVKGVTNPDAAVIDPSLAAELMRMLETVTGPQGTALLARVANYRVAGKTGTARKAGAAGYQSRYVSVFAGLAPVSDPRLVGVVVLHDPSAGAYFGGLTAAPVFGRVMAGALRLLNVPPDDVGSPNLLLTRSFEELREAAAEAVEGAASP
jgi:cell division protein FtsI (penicillin-binding protein 3)